MTDTSVHTEERVPLSEEERREQLHYLINYNCCPMHIYPADDSTEALIFALFTRKVKVPSELSFGEPYDSAFIAFSEKYFRGRPSHEHFLFNLLQFTDQLSIFLVLALQARRPTIHLDLIDRIKELIWSKIPQLSASSMWSSLRISDLQSTIRSPQISRLDLVYIAVILDQLEILDGDLSLYNFVFACLLK